MTRRILLIAALGSSLAACSPDASHQQQTKAQKDFDQSVKTLGYVRRGIRDVKIDPKQYTPIDQYRQQQLDAAAAAVQPVAAASAPAAQQMAAALLISEAHASHARNFASHGVRAWAEEGAAQTDLVDLASQLRLASAAAQQRAAVDHSKVLADLGQTAQQLTQQQTQTQARVSTIQQTIDGIQQQLKTLAQQQREKMNASDDLSRKAFVAKAQQQYDLYVQAADATRGADKLTAQADVLRAQLNVAQAQLAAEQVKLKGVTREIADVQGAAQGVQQRTQQVHQLADDSKKEVARVQQRFDAVVKKLLADHESLVVGAFTQAIKEHEQAVAQAQKAAKVAPSDGQAKPAADLAVASAQAEQGFTCRQFASAQASFADTLTTVAQSIAQTVPDRAKPLSDAADAARKKADDAREQAKALLTKAASSFDTLATTAKTGRQPKLERAAVRSIASADDSLAAVTGDHGYDAKAKEARDRAAAITIPE